MFINKRKNSYGWYSKIVSKDLNGISERTGYISFSFKKGCEPKLDDSIEGDLYFIAKDGDARKVFPVVKEYNGNVSVEFKLLEVEKFKKDQYDYKRSYDLSKFDEEDLPF